MGIITERELEERIEVIQKIQKEIRQFTPIVKADLKHHSEAEFIKKVCNNIIEYRVSKAKEGDFLYQCSYFNRKYFDAKNSKGRILKEKPGIDVNVAGLAKFVVDCPHAGEFMCKLRDFVLNSSREKDIKNL